MTKIYAAAVLAFGIAACSHNAPTAAQQQELQQKAAAELNVMRSQQPGIDALLSSAAGYVVFPSIGEAGALYVGGAYGKGVLYQGGQVVGYVALKQGSLGLTLGGKTYGELLLLRSQYDVDRLKAGKFSVGGDAGLAVLTAGAQTKGTIDPNTSVIVRPHGGLMANLTVSGQHISMLGNAG
jgi:lipid-binding SYLF domain-containing protein